MKLLSRTVIFFTHNCTRLPEQLYKTVSRPTAISSSSCGMEILTRSAVLLLFLSRSAVPVSVSSRQPRVEVQENHDAVLSCVFRTEMDTDPRIEWKKRDPEVSLIYYNKKFTGEFAGRAKITGATVTLSKVTYRDTGVYQCEVTAPEDDVKLGETNVTLIVLVAPATPTCEIPSSALSGTTVELHCNDKHSVPPATYRWYKDNALLSNRGVPNATYTIDTHSGTLRFKTVSLANSGRYHCEASNGVGKPKSCEAREMNIGDLNIPLIIAAVIGTLLVLCMCVLGFCYARRRGYCRKNHRGSRNMKHTHSAQHIRDFKHTQSFML